MKKLITALTVLLLIVSCTRDEHFADDIITPVEVSQLLVTDTQGLKLESYIVQGRVKINIKLATPGVYRLKIYDFKGDLVNQEKVTGVEGDNILNIYVSALPNGTYTVKLQTLNNQAIGEELFSKI
jgi:hypothetical protein|tara:strand:- start:6 stop:383 length:378 start_codon:yes stop_codon:yes gene_type:complete